MSEGSNSFTEHLAGGGIRVSVNNEPRRQDGAQQVPEAFKVHTGVLREDGSGQFARFDGRSASTAGSVLATARSNAGPTSNFKGADTSVEVEPGNPASRTSIATALRMGVIREPYLGCYEDVQAAPAAPGAEAGQSPGEDSHTPELAEQQAEADWAADIEAVPQHAYDAAVASGANAVLDTTAEGWQKTAAVLASNTGMSPDAAAEYVEAGYSFFETQVAKMANGVGIEEGSKEAFYDFMRSKHPQALQAATGQLVSTRRLDGFRQLATAFKVEQGTRQLPEWRARGFDGAYVNRTTGDVMLSMKGGAAVRARDLK